MVVEVENLDIESGIVIAAKYDGNGALKNIKWVSVEQINEGTVTIEGITVDKIFIWYSIDGLSPVCLAKPVNVQQPPAEA